MHAPRVYLVRHGQTAWSLSGQHTSRTDLPLTARGEEEARRLAPMLAKIRFAHVLCSPRKRARQTCELAGFGSQPEIDVNLTEWDYGKYEGLTGPEVQRENPGWNIYTDGCPGGESPEAISQRADAVIKRIRSLETPVLIFSHGHFLRILAARWVEWPVSQAKGLFLSTASRSALGFEHEDPSKPVIAEWNVLQPDGK